MPSITAIPRRAYISVHSMPCNCSGLWHAMQLHQPFCGIVTYLHKWEEELPVWTGQRLPTRCSCRQCAH